MSAHPPGETADNFLLWSVFPTTRVWFTNRFHIAQGLRLPVTDQSAFLKARPRIHSSQLHQNSPALGHTVGPRAALLPRRGRDEFHETGRGKSRHSK